MTSLDERLKALSPEQRERLLKRLSAVEKSKAPAGIPTVDRGKPLPTSFAQERLWFLDRLDPGNPAYNMAEALKLDGVLHLGALRQSCATLVERHESLRTVFVESEGKATQAIRQPQWELPVVDLKALPPQSREKVAARLSARHAMAPFDLENGPLFRYLLFDLGPQKHILSFVLHHIISDGWSMGVMVEELATLYGGMARGLNPRLAPLRIQYADYAAWLREKLNQQVLKKHLAFWTQWLRGAETMLALPGDRQRPDQPSFRGTEYRFSIAGKRLAGLRQLSRDTVATLFMTLLAVYQVFLFRITRQDDLSVATPIANREQAGVKGLIGFFVNTLVLRAEMNGNQSFRNHLKQVKKTSLEAFSHRDLPFEKLVEALQPKRDATRNPLAQVSFSLQNAAIPALSFPGLSISSFKLDQHAVAFDLSLRAEEKTHELQCIWEVSLDVFDPQAGPRLAEMFLTLLDAALENPNVSLRALPLLKATEQSQLLATWNGPQTQAPFQSVMEIIHAQADRNPTGIALSLPGENNAKPVQMNYRDLVQHLRSLAGSLARRGIGPEVSVGVLCERSFEMVIAELAILEAGGFYLPLDPDLPVQRLQNILQQSGTKTVVAQAKWHSLLDGGNHETLILDGADGLLASSAANPVFAGPRPLPQQAAYLLYTSGSTGQPKGALNSHGALANHMRWMAETYPLDETDKVVQKTPFGFDASIWEFFAPLMAGAEMVIAKPGGHGDPAYLTDLIISQNVSTLQVVPTFLRALLEELVENQKSLPLKRLFVGGEVLDPELVEQVATVTGKPLINLYGPTETCIQMTSHVCQPGQVPTPIGKPIHNVAAYVLDDALQPLPMGISGELCIGGTCVGRGYFGSPKLTAAAFLPDPFANNPGARLYKTGDVARYSTDGTLAVLGRMDGQVKLRGFRLEIDEIRAALHRHEAIKEAAVILWTEDDAAPRLVAYLVPREKGLPASEELKKHLRTTLPEYMVPSTFMELAEMPLTTSGKLDRRSLPTPTKSEADEAKNPPRTQRQVLLASVWEEFMALRPADIYDDFFELGGHSLMATQVLSRVRRYFGIEVSLRQFFQNPTVSGLDDMIAAASAEDGFGPIPPMEPRESRKALPLSFAQQRLWFFDQLEPNSSQYLIPASIRVKGALDAEALRLAIESVVARHEVLRTSFVVTKDQPFQVIREPGHWPLQVIDLTEIPTSQRLAMARHLSEKTATLPFDLAADNLMRTQLISLGENDYLLNLTIHHIVFDGWSLANFVREIATFYTASVNQEPLSMPPLEIQYGDYAAWQREWLQGEHLERQLAFWNKSIADAPVTALRPDKKRPAFSTYQAGYQELQIQPDLWAEINKLCKAQGVTPFMTLLAAFKVLIHAYTGQEDLSIGTPVSNRNRAEIEPLIGFFVNTLVLRTDLSGNPRFSTVLDRVRTVSLGAFDNQDLPFERLVEEQDVARDLSLNPLFQMMFAVQNVPNRGLELPGLHMETESVPPGQGTFDLSIIVSEDENQGADVLIEFNTDLFYQQTMARFARHWLQLLKQAVSGPQDHIGQWSLLNDAEHKTFLAHALNTSTDYLPEATLHGCFLQQVQQNPDKIAVVCHGANLSYRDLWERADQLADHLVTLGIGPESVVGLCMDRSAEVIVALLGILQAGAGFLPLDPEYPPDRMSIMISDSKAELVLTRGMSDRVSKLSGVSILDLKEQAEAIENTEKPTHKPASCGANLAYVTFTSGTTGRPKGTAIEHRSAINEALGAIEAFDFRPTDRMMQFGSLGFDIAIEEIFSTLIRGATLVMRPEALPDPAGFGLDCRKIGVDVVDLPTAYWHQLVDLSDLSDLAKSLRVVVIGGERALATHLTRWQRELGSRVKLFNAYGPTETTAACTHWDFSAEDAVVEENGQVPIGHPMINVGAYVLDRYLNPLPHGIRGELYIGGGGVGRGYLGYPSKSAANFVPDPFSGQPGARMYRTGDSALYRQGGEIIFEGRTDGQVKIRGYRVETGEIETVIGTHPQVDQCAVFSWEYEDRNQGDQTGREPSLTAYLVATGDNTLTASELRDFVDDTLPSYMVPSDFIQIPELPLTVHGKLDRKRLPRPEKQQVSKGSGPRARDEIRAVTLDVLQDVLGVADLEPDQDFFLRGGHSLLATRAAARLRNAFGVDLPLRAFFENPTAAGLAETLRGLIGDGTETGPPPIQPLAEGQPVPLSFAQQRLWFLDQLEPGSALYNITALVKLTGSMDKALFSRAVDQLIHRHQVLRTVFPRVKGYPSAKILPFKKNNLAVNDLRALIRSTAEERLSQSLKTAVQWQFDLGEGPLLQIKLILVSDDVQYLLLNMHHIVTDGWSMDLMVEELITLYGAGLAGIDSPLEALPVQYGDFAHWQRQWLQGPILEKQTRYWHEKLAQVPVLDFPTDFPRPAVQSGKGAHRELQLPGSLSRSIRALAKDREATLFMTFCASFQVFLHHYTGQEDFCLGTPVANRPIAEVEPLIGFFVNTLVLRADLSGNPSFLEILERTRRTALEAFSNQDLPFERLVESLPLERDLARSPLFQVFFNYATEDQNTHALPGLVLESQPLESEMAKFDISVTVVEGPEVLRLVFEYDTELFHPKTIERMLDQYQTLLEVLCEDASVTLDTTSMLPASERQQLLVDFNDTPTASSETGLLHWPMQVQAAQSPDAVAIHDGHRVLTYGALEARANAMAEQLRQMGSGPETRTGILLDRSIELVVGIFAILKTGAAYVPLDPKYPLQRLSFIARDAAISALVTRSDLVDTVSLPEVPDLLVDQITAEFGETQKPLPVRRPEPNQLAYLIYTSGSTGTPKGVAIEHNQAAAMIAWAGTEFPKPWLQGVLASTSVCFDLSIFEIFLPLSNGGSVVMVENALQLPQAAVAPKVTLINTVPSAMAALLADHQLPPSVKVVNLAGEPLPGDLARGLYRQPNLEKVYNLYGPSETTTYSTFVAVPREMPGAPTIGRPIGGTSIYLISEAMSLKPTGVPGELAIGGAGVARGYLGRPAMTASRFVPDPFSEEPGARLYRTGDLARIKREGEDVLDFLGRSDHQVKLRGFRIELGEIENALRETDEVAECLVTTDRGKAEDMPGDARLVAYLVGRKEADVKIESLRNRLAEKLPGFMVPSSFVILESFPLTPNGKIDRKALPKPDSVSFGGVQVRPRTVPESQMASIWETVLGTSDLGVTDNFFQRGGHSLLAVRLMSLIETEFGKPVPLGVLFQAPTIEGLVRWLEDGSDSLPMSCMVPMREGGSQAPLFLVHPIGGNLLSYADLVAALNPDRPVFGFQSRGLLGQPSHEEIQTMAASYLDEMRAAQPEGPYHLGGWSMGGVIAFEMARQLRAMGERVAHLALIDSSAPGSFSGEEPLDPNQAMALFAMDLTGVAGTEATLDEKTLQQSKSEDEKSKLLDFAKAHGLFPQEASERDFENFFGVFQANLGALQQYRPEPLPVNALLVRSNQDGVEEKDLGWGSLIAGSLTITEMDGDHYNLFVRPRVSQLAEILHEYLTTETMLTPDDQPGVPQ